MHNIEISKISKIYIQKSVIESRRCCIQTTMIWKQQRNERCAVVRLKNNEIVSNYVSKYI